MNKPPLFEHRVTAKNSYQVQLNSPTSMPNATSFLWNDCMMIQMNCKGYASAQFMQPEPSRYTYAPNIEATTFMQPEQPYYANHPGRFFYIKEKNTDLFSVPFEPVKKTLDEFRFIASDTKIQWQIKQQELDIELTLALDKIEPIEHWTFVVKNQSDKDKVVDIYPYFPIGYMSWMNQSAHYDDSLNTIIAQSITPYQKVEQYFENKNLKDITFLASDSKPKSWVANQQSFEGEGSLADPQAISADTLPNTTAAYETPTAAMQFSLTLLPGQSVKKQFLFGAASKKEDIAIYHKQYFEINEDTPQVLPNQSSFSHKYQPAINVTTGHLDMDAILNHWLPRQISYHHELNRLTTDPQTRNYLQDNMGMVYIKPSLAKQALLKAISQQSVSGAMPDGILLHKNAKLKYINQIPHADHSIWLPLILLSYLDETNDKSILLEPVRFKDSDQLDSVQMHIELALDHLIEATDKRNLSFIEQGDWCDPMNMVGYKGQGVSSWLTMASCVAIDSWTEICQRYLPANNQKRLDYYRQIANQLRKAINCHFWHQQWYARGITDDGRLFGTCEDEEGQIFLNTQSWGILSGAADPTKIEMIVEQVEKKLTTPFGPMMLAPSYTRMYEDIGRVTQKHPGVSENGSVYNHAAIFYIYSLYQIGKSQLAYDLLLKVIPSLASAEKTGQLPTFIPNYYRGAYYQLPSHAGRSSQLLHTGSVAWIYKCFIEQLCGMRGASGELTISPQLPRQISHLAGVRQFLGATFEFSITKANISHTTITLDGNRLSGNIINRIINNKLYILEIQVPKND